MDEAIPELQQAVTLAPGSAECHYNLGRAYAATERFPEALPQFEAAAKLTANREPAILQMLAAMYSETGNFSQAVLTAQQALEIAEKQQNAELTSALRANLARYQHQALSGPSAQN
jgi:tetratricopeptide (TPR) repeat protein